MQRQELEKLGWTTRGLSHLENQLQSCQDEARKQACYRSVLVFASPLFQEMWQRELQGLTEGRAHRCSDIDEHNHVFDELHEECGVFGMYDFDDALGTSADAPPPGVGGDRGPTAPTPVTSSADTQLLKDQPAEQQQPRALDIRSRWKKKLLNNESGE